MSCSPSSSGTTRSRNTSSWARSSASGHRKTRCAPARAYASSFSAHSSAEPIGSIARSSLHRTIEHRRQHVGEHRVGACPVLGDVAPHRRDAVREPRDIAPACRHLRLDVRPGLGEQLRGRVVAGGEPAVGKARHASQPRRRSPAPDPDRWTGALRRRRGQREAGGGVERTLKRDVVGSPVRTQRLHCLVQPLPALLESARRPARSPEQTNRDRARPPAGRRTAGRSPRGSSRSPPVHEAPARRRSSRASSDRCARARRPAPSAHRATGARTRDGRSRRGACNRDRVRLP